MNKNKDDIFNYLDRSARAIAEMFGPSCETLVHDMGKPGHPILVIYNGHISNREVGSTADIYGGNRYATDPSFHFSIDQDVTNAHVITQNGRHIKSTTINCIGQDYHYALGINFDYTYVHSAIGMLSSLAHVEDELDTVLSENTSTQLESIFEQCVALVGKPTCEMKKADRLQLISLLMQKNAFRFQKSIAYISEQLGVSRYTIYNYYHELEKNPLP